MPTPTVNFDFKRTTRSPSGRRLLRTSDGDTPVIEQPIRMVSCDTPEKAGYAGGPAKSQPKLNKCKERLESNYYPEIPDELKSYLISKITLDAAERHIESANDASKEFDSLLSRRLTKEDGKIRKTAVIPTGQLIDVYGRLLAYIAPWYESGPDDPLPPRDDPRRKTFNLNMIELGWAAFFPIYPSLPRNDDFNIAIKVAEKAWDEKLGAWSSYGEDLLLAYEYRMCIKLGTAESSEKGMKNAFQRICIDLRNLKIMGKFGFYDVPPCYRLWVWEEDLDLAKLDLGLMPI